LLQTPPFSFPIVTKSAYQQACDELFHVIVKRLCILFETLVPTWSALQIFSNYCSPYFVLCLTGNIENTVLFKNWVVFGEEFSFSLFEVRISKACHLDSGQCGAVGGTPLFNIGPFQVSVDRQRSEEVFDLVVARTTPINGRDGDMVFLYQLEKDRELPDFTVCLRWRFSFPFETAGFGLDILGTLRERLKDCESLMG
jgi:hypothetical protein